MVLLPCLCQEPCGHPDMEFHLESLKSIPVAELGTLDRLGGQPPPPAEKKGGRSPREKEAAHRPGAMSPALGRSRRVSPQSSTTWPEIWRILDRVGGRSGKGVEGSHPNAAQGTPCVGESSRVSS